MTALLAIVRKDLKLFLSDRRALIMSFAAPIALASFFGFVFSSQGMDDERGRIAIHVIDHDGSPISKKIVADLTADKSLNVLATADEAAARSAVQRGKSTVAVVIPQGFGAAAAIALREAPSEQPRFRALRDRLEKGLAGVEINGHPEHRLAHTTNLCFAGVDADALMNAVPEIAVSSSAACTSAQMQPSYVLGALEVFIVAFLPSTVSPYRDAVVFALLIAFLLFRPAGLVRAAQEVKL